MKVALTSFVYASWFFQSDKQQAFANVSISWKVKALHVSKVHIEAFGQTLNRLWVYQEMLSACDVIKKTIFRHFSPAF